jgi:hypothetical protein
MKRILLIILVSAITLIVVLSLVGPHKYQVAVRNNGAELWWNNREAFLIVTSSRAGYVRTYPESLVELIVSRTSFSGRSPSEVRRDLAVWHFQDGRIDQFRRQNTAITLVTALEQHLYTRANGSPVRLGRNGLDAASEVEQRAIDAAQKAFDERVWSRRQNLLSDLNPVTQFAIQVGSDEWVITANNHFSPMRWRALDAQRKGDRSQRLWQSDEQVRDVTAEEYERFLNE